VLRTIATELDRYQGQTSEEIRELARVRDLIAGGDPWRRSTPFHITASAVVVHVPTRRVLLRWHARQQAWLQIGGHGDPGETDPIAIAVREGVEETGLTDLRPWPEPAIVHIVIVSVPAAPHEPAHEHADVRYVLATDDPDAATPENPAAELRWLSVAEADALTSEPNLRETLRRVDLLLRSV
jgi:8-oxo-dGTP pyrophosphatase MutT (NUDIX family)